jgi:hypothetical protein
MALFDTSFNFGANVLPKKTAKGKGKKKPAKAKGKRSDAWRASTGGR